jgi:hypothetical protein
MQFSRPVPRVTGPTRSLEVTREGDVVRISAILLDPLRTLCSEIGLHEGDVIACRSVTPTLVLLETPAGHTVALLRERARFVRVAAVA